MRVLVPYFDLDGRLDTGIDPGDTPDMTPPIRKPTILDEDHLALMDVGTTPSSDKPGSTGMRRAAPSGPDSDLDTWVKVFRDELGETVASVASTLDARSRCDGCGEEMDLTTCWCGDSEENHGAYGINDHTFVEMGCRCRYDDPSDDPYRIIEDALASARREARRGVRTALRNLGEAIHMTATYWPACPEGCTTGCIRHGSFARGVAIGAGAWSLQYLVGGARPYGSLVEFVPRTDAERGFVAAILERNERLSFRVGPDAGTLESDDTDDRFAVLEMY